MEHEQYISGNFNPQKMHADDVVISEAFLRASREILDKSMVEKTSLDQIRGAVMMLEKYMGIRDQVTPRTTPAVDRIIGE